MTRTLCFFRAVLVALLALFEPAGAAADYFLVDEEVVVAGASRGFGCGFAHDLADDLIAIDSWEHYEGSASGWVTVFHHAAGGWSSAPPAPRYWSVAIGRRGFVASHPVDGLYIQVLDGSDRWSTCRTKIASVIPRDPVAIDGELAVTGLDTWDEATGAWVAHTGLHRCRDGVLTEVARFPPSSGVAIWGDRLALVLADGVHIYDRLADAWTETGWVPATGTVEVEGNTLAVGATLFEHDGSEWVERFRAPAGPLHVGDGVATAGGTVWRRQTEGWVAHEPVPGHAITRAQGGRGIVLDPSHCWFDSESDPPETPHLGSLRIGRLVFTPVPIGGPCLEHTMCADGICVDGVCCDSACGAGASDDCLACSVAAGAASDGVCTVLTGRVCRSARGSCDAAEVCTAGTATCPPDAVAPTGTTCRAATTCEPAAVCDGASTECPTSGPDAGSCGGDVDAGAEVDAGARVDGDTSRDSGRPVDAGRTITPSGGGCAVASADRSSPVAWVLGALWLARRSRRYRGVRH